MPTLADIRRALGTHAPRVLPRAERHAAVAIVLHEADTATGSEVLFIERAQRDDDPWSGHMAFPGGRLDPTDPDPRSAAERETREEVGIDLATADALSRLDDLDGGAAGYHPLVVSAFIYQLPTRRPLSLNYEVCDALWIPLEALLDPARHIAYPYPPDQRAMHYPGIVVGDPRRQVVWGLTYRFLDLFFSALGRPLPVRR